MATVNIHEAKTHLSRLLEAGRPVAMLTPIAAPARRQPGRDRVVIHDDFDEPLTDFAEYAALMGPPQEPDV